MSTIKRTSIPSFATLHEVSNSDETHVNYSTEGNYILNKISNGVELNFGFKKMLDLAPPPPAPSDPPCVTVATVEDIDLTALPPPPDFLLEAESGGASSAQQQSAEATRIITERSLSVADAVKTLNEIRHQPASPNVVRRAQSMHSPQAPPPCAARQKTGPATAPKNTKHNSSTLQHSSSMKSATKSPLNHCTKTLPRHLPTVILKFNSYFI